MTITRLSSGTVPGISNAVRAQGLIFISGQTADPRSPGSFEQQINTAFARMQAILDHFNASNHDLLRLNLYATQLPARDLAEIRGIRDRWGDPESLPASTLIGVHALALPGLEFEVDAVCLEPAAPAQ